MPRSRGQKIQGFISCRDKPFLSSSERPNRLMGSTQSLPNGYGGGGGLSFLGGKMAGAWIWPRTTTQRKECSYTSPPPPHIRLHGADRDKLYLIPCFLTPWLLSCSSPFGVQLIALRCNEDQGCSSVSEVTLEQGVTCGIETELQTRWYGRGAIVKCGGSGQAPDWAKTKTTNWEYSLAAWHLNFRYRPVSRSAHRFQHQPL